MIHLERTEKDPAPRTPPAGTKQTAGAKPKPRPIITDYASI